ncbi:unnamed protein product [Heligmosomoides polygyrus]|uniref:Uncharacterized protein n=1 Tax=Heligmosomoides polygyrus TaxID=6339 RepID=A0A3P7TFZ8_HELPZ|nr:unnamed protein product [Heligmosomoides polygyrus]
MKSKRTLSNRNSILDPRKGSKGMMGEKFVENVCDYGMTYCFKSYSDDITTVAASCQTMNADPETTTLKPTASPSSKNVQFGLKSVQFAVKMVYLRIIYSNNYSNSRIFDKFRFSNIHLNSNIGGFEKSNHRSNSNIEREPSLNNV